MNAPSNAVITFTVGDLLVGLPVVSVQEVLAPVPVTPAPRTGEHIAGLMNLRGQVVTAIDLRTRFATARPGPAGGVVIVRSSDAPVGLVVDGIGDVIEVSEDEFEPPPATLSGPARDLIVGAYKLPTGLLMALRLDVATAAAV